MLARRASYDKKTLARQVIPLAPGYRTALSSRPAVGQLESVRQAGSQSDKQTDSFSYYFKLMFQSWNS